MEQGITATIPVIQLAGLYSQIGELLRQLNESTQKVHQLTAQLAEYESQKTNGAQ